MGWISIDNIPELNDEQFSDNLFVKVDKKRRRGYYDGFIKKWFYYCKKFDSMEECNPTHWEPLDEKPKQ